jgi:beta-galactosidase
MIGTVQLVSGELHYARIPRVYWKHRLEMAAAMGLNAISTYVFWNRHETQPGRYDFDGENDVAEFLRQAAAAGLAAILRPGPYVCAEWDFGGLPAWLLADGPIGVRTTDERFMAPVRRWLRRLGTALAPLQRTRGGPIVAVQLENEYGAFGRDAKYLQALRAALDDAGFGESPYYTIDQPADLARGALPGIAAGVTFGPAGIEDGLRTLPELRPDGPKICGEYWAGWFDRWREPHAPDDPQRQARDLETMLAAGWSVNAYMFAGGTNFGFSNGANVDGDRYAPVTTSYDYRAALDEAGHPTPKYFLFRDVIARRTGAALRPLPPAPARVEVPEFALTESADIDALLREPIVSVEPRAMESLGQSFGYVLYRTTMSEGGTATLEIESLRDFATILLDGAAVAHLDRRLGEARVGLERVTPGARLDILVENCGRVNYGPELADQRKGIVGAVRWNGRVMRGWEHFALPFDDLSGLRFDPRPRSGPGFFRGRFDLAELGDAFLDVGRLGKGVLFVNGRNAGRFWNVGPQRQLFVPAPWLRLGRNEIVSFDVMPSPAMAISSPRRSFEGDCLSQELGRNPS